MESWSCLNAMSWQAEGTRFPRRLRKRGSFPEGSAGPCGVMAVLVLVRSPLPRLRALLQHCWGRLERGLWPSVFGDQSPPWGRSWPLLHPAEGTGCVPVLSALGRVWSRWFQRSLPTPSILGFCERAEGLLLLVKGGGQKGAALGSVRERDGGSALALRRGRPQHPCRVSSAAPKWGLAVRNFFLGESQTVASRKGH